MGYNIRWVSEGRQDSTTVGDVNSLNVSFNIQPNTQYNVSVSAINTGGGQGPFSQPAIVMTVQDGKRTSCTMTTSCSDIPDLMILYVEVHISHFPLRCALSYIIYIRIYSRNILL